MNYLLTIFFKLEHQVSDSMSRMRCKTVAWHPNVATQLCLASEDDQFPVIQLWDLRYATSPAKTFEGHNQGILSMAWCSQVQSFPSSYAMCYLKFT